MMKKIRTLTVLALVLPVSALMTLGSASEPGSEQCLGGSLNAPIRIEVFSDFQCPACRTLYMDTMKQVIKDYCSTGKVCVIYREFPLPVHSHAREAARYSLAAQKLGRQQWLAVVDSLYNDQPIWSQNGLVQVSVARVLSPLDYQEVQKLMQDQSINQAIEREIALGQQRKVASTPTMFVTVNGKEQMVAGGVPYNVLKDFFDKTLSK